MGSIKHHAICVTATYERLEENDGRHWAEVAQAVKRHKRQGGIQ